MFAVEKNTNKVANHGAGPVRSGRAEERPREGGGRPVARSPWPCSEEAARATDSGRHSGRGARVGGESEEQAQDHGEFTVGEGWELVVLHVSVNCVLRLPRLFDVFLS